MQNGDDMRPVPNSVDIVNAAAAAIVSAEGRTQPPLELRRKWTDRLRVYFCFGSQQNGHSINPAALVPEPMHHRTNATTSEIPENPAPPVFPFVAPPSSPASLLQSDPTSNVQSPNSPSPTGTPCIFAIGPYAYETQLVSPPVFSDSTEPSTTPFTPPPESVHLKTPSSPEVPYAEILTSINNNKSGDLQSYPNYPDSPITHSISPSLGFCGTYSSFPDPETTKILDGEGDATQNLIHHHMCNGGSPFDGDITDGVPIADFSARLQPNDHAMNRRVSFELTVEGVVRCLEKKSAISRDSTTASFHFSPTSSGDHKRESNHTRAGVHDEMYHDLPEKVRRSLSLRQAREFKFNNIESTDSEANMGSDWWANEKVSEITAEPEKGMSSDPVSARVS
ncbi:hypothetical protein HU200_038185 [Digitaria exilis]|uniref:Uncharacterized protein n=1 Tax=Digitaria exilis TaxID=1010633 RepID=A0A835BP85_9POAL|nr:hypothetical protein HU200_038185 [Digitaria exilis]